MKYVAQRHYLACVVACMTMITGDEYEQVERELGFAYRPVYAKEVRDYLAFKGYKMCLRRHTREPFGEQHICLVFYKRKSVYAHMVVMDKTGRVYDPEEEGITDLGVFYKVLWVASINDIRA